MEQFTGQIITKKKTKGVFFVWNLSIRHLKHHHPSLANIMKLGFTLNWHGLLPPMEPSETGSKGTRDILRKLSWVFSLLTIIQKRRKENPRTDALFLQANSINCIWSKQDHILVIRKHLLECSGSFQSSRSYDRAKKKKQWAVKFPFVPNML